MTTVFIAALIHTMDPSCPQATAVAVRDGRILHVGEESEVLSHLQGTTYEVDRRFESVVLVPGFVEAHGHLVANGMVDQYVWLGFDDRPRPDGSIARGCRSIDEVVERLATAVAQSVDEGRAVAGFGFDPSFHDGRSLTRHDLDRASTEARILVLNASLHLAYANSALMSARGVTSANTERGVMKDEAGEPTGVFQETAMNLLFAPGDMSRGDGSRNVWNGGWLAHNAGCTTMTEMAATCAGQGFETLLNVANQDDFPVRVVYSPSVAAMSRIMERDDLLTLCEKLRAAGSDRVQLGPVKWIADGSIQGFTGKLNWPGYCSGEDHGFLILDEDTLVDQVKPFHDRGFQAAIHTNGDEATEAALRAIERILVTSPRPDHRHRLEHCQLASRDQFRRMATLGVGANLFSNHLFYWGDIHRTKTVGPDKARRMNAAATAAREGVHYSLHSDAPVTPVAPLFTMWCAVNRVTRTGHVLGEHEKISPAEALEAMTLGAAWLLKLDHKIGSIEVGKLADFTALGADPLTVDPLTIKDIPVMGTVLGGVPVTRPTA